MSEQLSLSLTNPPRVFDPEQHECLMDVLGMEWPSDMWPRLWSARSNIDTTLTQAGISANGEHIRHFLGALRYALLHYKDYCVSNPQCRGTLDERKGDAIGITFEALSEVYLRKRYKQLDGIQVHSDFGYIGRAIVATYPRRGYIRAQLRPQSISGYLEVTGHDRLPRDGTIVVRQGLPDFLITSQGSISALVEATTSTLYGSNKDRAIDYFARKLRSVAYMMHRMDSCNSLLWEEFANVIFVVPQKKDRLATEMIREVNQLREHIMRNEFNNGRAEMPELRCNVLTVPLGRGFSRLVSDVYHEIMLMNNQI